MSKQFTVITKDGRKWLRPVLNPSDTDQLSRFFQNAGDGFEDVIYIGSRPEGTVLDESEVREVRQYRLRGTDYWFHPNDSEYKSHELDVRTAYTDVDWYPSIDYQPLFNHMSNNYGLTLTTSEMDEIIGLSTYILAKK